MTDDNRESTEWSVVTDGGAPTVRPASVAWGTDPSPLAAHIVGSALSQEPVLPPGIDAHQVLLRKQETIPRLMMVDADKADAYVAIVRELAENGPFIDEYWTCKLCGAGDFGFESDATNVPANHEPSCLWRRARELYPKEPA